MHTFVIMKSAIKCKIFWNSFVSCEWSYYAKAKVKKLYHNKFARLNLLRKDFDLKELSIDALNQTTTALSFLYEPY